jgi:hypothetical protein
MSRLCFADLIKSNTILIGMLLVGAFGLGVSRGMPPEAPGHSMVKANGNGWECDLGYLEVGYDCVADLSAPPDRPGKHLETDMRLGGKPENLAREIEKLQRIIRELSLRNAVLRSARRDDD